MMWLFPLLLVPVFVVLVGKQLDVFKHTVSYTEAAVLILLCGGLMIPGFFIAKSGAMTDYEYWNGRVSAKPTGKQGCCHCTEICSTCTDRDGNTYDCNCYEVCDHNHDRYYDISYTTGDHTRVKGCVPPRKAPPAQWTATQVGEPATILHPYTNYLKADPEAVYHQSTLADEWGQHLPAYPSPIGLHSARKAIAIGPVAFDPSAWSAALMEMNADLNTKGHRKKVNVTVIATNYRSRKAITAVEHEWLYGKMNDAIFVLGAPDGHTIEWAELVTTPGHNEAFKTAVRHGFDGWDLEDPDLYDHIYNLTNDNWHWSGVEDFKYLASAAVPSTPALLGLFMTAIFISVGGLFLMDHHSLFGDDNQRYRKYRY